MYLLVQIKRYRHIKFNKLKLLRHLLNLGDAFLWTTIEQIDKRLSIAHCRTRQSIAVFILHKSTAE